MKRAILAAITCCTIAGVAIGASTQQKQAATPAKKTSTVVAQKTVPQKKTASTTAGRAPVTSSASKKGRTTTTAARSTTPNRTGTATKTGTRTTSTRRYYARQQPVRRTYSAQQTTPTADRYREIQDALAAKGYLKTPPSGVWDKDSIDAMTRFQQDQKLDATGKLTARSLGALGLGPKTASESAAAIPSASLSPSSTGEATPLQ